MCIVFLALDTPDNSAGFTVLANRDEFVDRPTAGAHRWTDRPGLIGGRDLEAGGTWLAVTPAGRFAAVTNVRAPDRVQSGKRSRGDLVTAWVDGGDSIAGFSHTLMATAGEYNPFNLLFGEKTDFVLYDGVEHTLLNLTRGVHAFSNGSPQTPWPKVRHGRNAFEQALPVGRDTADSMVAVARDATQAPDSALPETGVPQDIERQLSSVFIPEGELGRGRYGTVSTSLLVWTPAGGFLQEWNWRSSAGEPHPRVIEL
ncbi:MAG: NRDE family protein [Pseudomonadota bacterium]